MKILYDHQAFDMQRFGGVSNCFVQLLSHFPDGVEYDISLLECDNVHLRGSGLIDVKPASLSPDHFILRKHFLGQGVLYGWYSKLFPAKTSYGRNRLCSIEKLKQGDFDVFHPTFFDPYFLSFLNGKPYVLTVHDMIPELFSSKKDAQVINKPLLCQKAAHIIAVSEKTKQDLINILSIPEEKVTVIYHGSPSIDNISESKPLVSGRYFLYVGQRDRYKSFLPMVKALYPVLLHHQDIKIVCTGSSFSKKEMHYFENLSVANRIVHIRVNDVELRNLYSHAICFIYPSIYEGFGIPILEAYSANCPVLLNHASCFPEIAQDAAVYFHLDEQSSNLDKVMESFLQMPENEKALLLSRQEQRLSFFSWEKSAQKLANVYASII